MNVEWRGEDFHGLSLSLSFLVRFFPKNFKTWNLELRIFLYMYCSLGHVHFISYFVIYSKIFWWAVYGGFPSSWIFPFILILLLHKLNWMGWEGEVLLVYYFSILQSYVYCTMYTLHTYTVDSIWEWKTRNTTKELRESTVFIIILCV